MFVKWQIIMAYGTCKLSRQKNFWQEVCSQLNDKELNVWGILLLVLSISIYYESLLFSLKNCYSVKRICKLLIWNVTAQHRYCIKIANIWRRSSYSMWSLASHSPAFQLPSENSKTLKVVQLLMVPLI